MENFERLKLVRENKNLTQQTIADYLGVKRGTYASWECGSDEIPTTQIYKLANFYNKSINYLLSTSNRDIEVKCNKELNKVRVGKNIEIVRNKHNLSQAKFAASIDINQSTYGHMKKEKH